MSVACPNRLRTSKRHRRRPRRNPSESNAVAQHQQRQHIEHNAMGKSSMRAVDGTSSYLVASRPHLRPDMISPIVHMSRIKAHCSAEEREAVGPFTTAPTSCLQKCDGVVVARKPRHLANPTVGHEGPHTPVAVHSNPPNPHDGDTNQAARVATIHLDLTCHAFGLGGGYDTKRVGVRGCCCARSRRTHTHTQAHGVPLRLVGPSLRCSWCLCRSGDTAAHSPTQRTPT